MDKFLQQLKQAAQSEVFSADRKRLVKHALVEFMEANPAQPARSLKNDLASFLHRPLARTAMVLSMVLLIGGAGTAYASQNALPGDALYSFKVNVAEKVETALAVSTEQRAEAELVLSERRLVEASALVSSDKLSVDSETKLENQLQRHEQKFNAYLEKLSAEQKTDLAADMSARYEAMLRAHQQVVANIQATKQSGSEQKTKLDEKIKTDLQSAASVRTKLENRSLEQSEQSSQQRAAEAKIKAAEKGINTARRFIESSKRITPESKEAALAQLRRADETLAEARVKYEAKEYRTAYSLASKALRIAQSARTMITVKSKVNTRAEVNNDAEFFLRTEDEVKRDRSGNDDERSGESRSDTPTNQSDKDTPPLWLRLGF